MIKHIFILFCFLALSLAKGFAQETDASAADYPSTLKDHVEEVFLQGSQDGDRVFMVLGFKQSLKLSKKVLQKTIKAEELRVIGQRFNNEDHQNDFVDEFKAGREKSRSAFPEILKAPVRSFKKIPASFKVTIQQGEEAQDEAKTKVGGALKYSGYAVWAVMKGVYYLVIETPAQFLIKTSTFVGAVPLRMALQILEIGIRFAWFSTKMVAGLISSGAMIAYSAVSSIVGSTLVFVLKTPKYIFRPLQIETNLHVREDHMEDVSALFSQVIMKTMNLKEGQTIVVEQNDKKHKIKMEVYVEEDGKRTKAYVAKLKIENFRINLDLEMTRAYYHDQIKALKEEFDVGRKYAKKGVISEMENVVNSLQFQVRGLQVPDEVQEEQQDEPKKPKNPRDDRDDQKPENGQDGQNESKGKDRNVA